MPSLYHATEGFLQTKVLAKSYEYRLERAVVDKEEPRPDTTILGQ